MRDRAPPARPQTIKQAKAAYKSRGAPVLSEREKKQLERSVELEQRAWRTREAEKRRAETAKKKVEKDKRERDAQVRMQMTSQRRCDKFGYQRSQMHLGAFLRKQPDSIRVQAENVSTAVEDTDDSLGDSGLDDDTLLEAAEGLQLARSDQDRRNEDISPLPLTAAVDPRSISTSAQHNSKNIAMEDFSLFLDDLGSSTQIARELSTDEPPANLLDGSSHLSSFGDDDFDFTINDIEEMERQHPVQSQRSSDLKLMPPPPLPTKIRQAPIPSAVAHDFTTEELEDLFADEIQLTQVG